MKSLVGHDLSPSSCCWGRGAICMRRHTCDCEIDSRGGEASELEIYTPYYYIFAVAD